MSLITHTDVTAVKFYKNYILAGIGSYVYVFNKVTTKLLQRLHVLNAQKVYGFVISQCELQILVFGGKQFTVLTEEILDADTKLCTLFEPVKCDDWLYSALWSDKINIAVLTAHNVAQTWNISTQTLVCKYPSAVNSILYSGVILPVEDDMVVLAGTVYSEVIIHLCSEDKLLHTLKGHRGVIFFISCEPEKGIIITTSDDRSVRIWHMKNSGNHPHNSLKFWEHISIECNHEVYGHTARVMRSIIVNDLVISGGEDAGICYWRDGCLVRKVIAHQTASIWSMDSDGEYLVTGGGDGGVNILPLTVASYYGKKEMLQIEGNPKIVLHTARKNIVILNDVQNEIIYYDMVANFKTAHRLQHKSSYKMMAISSCKQLIAVADMEGVLNVFAEICKGPACIQNVIDTKLEVGKVRSMHWAGNRHLVLCAQDGAVTVIAARGDDTEVYAEFVLPPCKERWLTSCAIDPSNNMIVVGDRCSGIHLFLKGQKDPVKTFKKAHGNYGSTSLIIRNNELVSTGRDGTIKYYSIIKQDYRESKYLSTKEIEFPWVERFLDKSEKLICGFHSKTFIVFDIETNTKIIEIICGGGHRSYDAIRYFEKVNEELEEFIRLTYIKNSVVYLVTIQLSKIIPKTIVRGSHSKEINCLKSFKTDEDSLISYYISGGEDTSLRISALESDLQFRDVFVYKHLSNVRTLKTFPMKDNRLCVISAGGRAQICVNMFKFEKGDDNGINIRSQELVDFLLKGYDDERKRIRTWREQEIDFDPETRIMDVDAIRFDENKLLIFAGCSDGLLRTFTFNNDFKEVQFRPLKEHKHLKVCILKTVCIKYFNKDIVVTCTTGGHVTFWNVLNDGEIFDIKPVFTFVAHRFGINSFDYKIIGNDILIATGGDDTGLCMNLFEISAAEDGNLLVKKIANWKAVRYHCSQITGVILLDDLLLSTSIDQRITINKWEVTKEGFQCAFLKQVYSDVADIKGMELLRRDNDSVIVCVYGKGFEVLKIDIANSK